ncbi:hypothetical protein D3C81_445650 [compost metagenome]
MDTEHVLPRHAVGDDRYGDVAAVEVRRIGIAEGGIATSIDQHRSAAFVETDRIAIEVADHRHGIAEGGEVQRGVVLDALENRAIEVGEGLAVEANGVAGPHRQGDRRVDGPGRAGTGDLPTADCNGFDNGVVGGAHDIEVAAALDHTFVEGQHDVGRGRNVHPVVARGGADHDGRAVVLNDVGAGGGVDPGIQVDVTVAVEIGDPVVGAAGVGQAHAGKRRSGLGHDAERAVAIAARILPGRAVAAGLVEDVGIAVAVEVAHHQARTKDRCREGGARLAAEAAAVVAVVVAGGAVDPGEDVQITVTVEIADPVGVAVVVGEAQAGKRRNGLGHVGEGSVAIVERILPRRAIAAGLVEDVGVAVVVVVAHYHAHGETQRRKGGVRLAAETATVVAKVVALAAVHPDQQVDIAIAVKILGEHVVTRGVAQAQAGKGRGGLGQEGKGAVAVAARILPGRTVAAGLVEDVGIAITVKIARHGTHTEQRRRKGSGRTGAEAGGQQALVAAQLGAQGGALQHPAAALQGPVAAQGLGPGVIDGGRDIGAGQRRQLIDERLAGAVLADATAIQHQVAIGLERRADALQGCAVLGQVAAVEPDIAELYGARCPVGQQVDGIQAVAPFQVVGHLLQAVLARVEDYHLGAGKQAVD